MTEILGVTERYFQYLLDEAERLLEVGDFKAVALQVLVPHNNMRSGWTLYISQMYYNPANEEQRQMVERMKIVILKTIQGIIPNLKASRSWFDFVEIEFIARQLSKLGKEAPRELVNQTRSLILESERLGANKDLVWKALNLLPSTETEI